MKSPIKTTTPAAPLNPNTLLPYIVTLFYDMQPFDVKRYTVRVFVFADQCPTKSTNVARRALEEWLGRKDGDEYPKVVVGGNCAEAECISRHDYMTAWKEMRKYSPCTAWYRPDHATNPNMLPQAFCGLKKTEEGLKTI